LKKGVVLKKVSVHSLPHSLDIHLLKNGTAIFTWAFKFKTTEIYTQISTKGLEKTKSPLDDLDI
jgi:site-specific recombinase XerD